MPCGLSRYIMDELGSRIRAAPAGRAPGFRLAPFAWRQPDGRVELLSLLWALRDVAEGEAATCAGRLGLADYSSQAYWYMHQMLSTVVEILQMNLAYLYHQQHGTAS